MFHSRHGAMIASSGRERLVGELEPDLVVALAGAAVREGVAPRSQRDLDLACRDERTRGGRAEQVVVLVDRSRRKHRKEIVPRELLLRVDEVEVGGAGTPGLLREARGLLGLADVDGDRDDLAAVVLLAARE